MNTKMSLFAVVATLGLGSLTTGCYAETGYVVTQDAYAYDDTYVQPTLVAAGPDVWVVQGQPSVYYADRSYWMYSGDSWYRSSYSRGGWVAVNTAPVVVVNSRHYHSGTVYSRPVHHSPARPHIAHHPARPSVHHDAPSNPGPSFRGNGTVHLGSRPAVRSSSPVHVTARPTVHVNASPSFRASGSVHVHSSGHSRGRGR